MRAQIEERNIVVYLLLTLVTCGIFGIYWLIVILKDIATTSGEDINPWMVILLTIITCGIYGIYYSYMMGKYMVKAGENYNVKIEDNSILYLILTIFGFGIVTYCLVQNDLNTIAKTKAITSLCPIKALTGLNCPGCGITRMFVALFHGNIYQAFRYNPLVFIELPIIAILFLLYRFNKKSRKVVNILFIILLVITIVYGVLRNIPFFYFLAPTQV